MLSRSLFVSVLCLAALGCGQSEKPTNGGEASDYDPGPVPEGYTRFEVPPTNLMPGEDALLMQWIAGAGMEDMDVADVRGGQTINGHHVLLYATTDIEPTGTTRAWQNADQINGRFLGGFGAEGAPSLQLPPDVVYRVPMGRGLAANVHYINASSKPSVGRSYIDVKLIPASPSAKQAALFINTNTDFSIGPHQEATQDVSCVVQHDVSVFRWLNHMHKLGVSELSSVMRSGGGEVELMRDDTWSPDWEFTPPFAKWSLDAPFVLKAGDTLHSRCTWMNPGTDTVSFPSEMCVGTGLFLGASDITCLGGQWLE